MSAAPLPRHGGPLLVAAACLAAAVAFLTLDPAHTIILSAGGAFVRGAIVALLTLVCALGGGGVILTRLSPATLLRPDAWATALGAGLALQSTALSLLLVTGTFTPSSALLMVILPGLGWLARPSLPLPRPGPTALLLGAVLLAPAFIDALAPPTDTDEIYYQLAVPRYLLDHGALPGGLLHPDQSRPLPIQLLHAATLLVGGEAAPRLWNLLVGVALVLAVRQKAQARFGDPSGDLPALALLGSLSFLSEAGLAYPDFAIALWLLLAAESLLSSCTSASPGLREALAVGAWCGFAFAAKYTAAPTIAGLLLVHVGSTLRRGIPWHSRAAPLAAAALVALPVLPWWLRNVAAGLHPLFPFAGWPSAQDFVFVYPEKYGAGHTPLDALLLPFRLLFRAEPDSFVFLGRINLLWGALILGAAWTAVRGNRAARALLVVVAVGFIGWGMSTQLVRYLLPLAGVAAYLGGAAALRPRWALCLLFAASLPANLAPAWSRAAARIRVALGTESRDTFLERELPAWPAVRYLRENVPPEDTVALLNCWPSYYMIQPTLLGSVEDHVPTRHLVWAHGEDALRTLAEHGARWLLVGDNTYLRKSYRFLPEGVFEAQFRAPQRDIERLLTRDATRVYAMNHHAVWRLDVIPAAK